MKLKYRTNKVRKEDYPIHNWYRFVLSFPPHLVKHYLEKFELPSDSVVLDPFCGTGTSLVESRLNYYHSIGIEANPISYFASKTKLNWLFSPDELVDTAFEIAERVDQLLKEEGIDDYNLMHTNSIFLRNLPEESQKVLLKNSISPIPMHKSIALIEEITRIKDEPLKDHLLLACLNTIINNVSNLRFGPEVGVGKIKEDAALLNPWLDNVKTIAEDISSLLYGYENINYETHLGDSRMINQYLSPNSVQAVITSPPYPNEKDYSRATRLESVLLGLVRNMQEMRNIKKTFVRSNTRSVYKQDRRIELGKTSGFEKMYSKVTLQYFGGMAKHLANLRPSLTPGAKLAYVVGDQSSYFRVMIRTGQLLAEVAESLGYKVLDLELFRTRPATVSKKMLREEVLVLEYTGDNG
ncbi:MAG: DNA methyltransferase [Bacteroidetes bacterium SW_11_45_7]|nr:MAG: DNA methyltransferase [Bacteroidetes bacterium SW_11_45_7]